MTIRQITVRKIINTVTKTGKSEENKTNYGMNTKLQSGFKRLLNAIKR